MMGRGGRAASVARRALAAIEASPPGAAPDLDLVRPVVTLQLASSLFADGDIEGALAAARTADVGHRDTTQGTALRRTRVAFFAAVAGRIGEARHELAQLPPDEDVERVVGPYRAAAGRLARAFVAIEDLRLDDADSVLRELDTEMATNEFWPVHVLLDGLVALARGDITAATAVVGRVRDGRSSASSYWRHTLAAFEVTLLLAAGQADAAGLRLRRLDATHPAVRAATARVRLVTGDVPGALDLLSSPVASDAGPLAEVDRRLMLAMAASRLDHVDDARRELSAALDPSVSRLPWLVVPADDRRRLQEIAEDAGGPLDEAVRSLSAWLPVMPGRLVAVQLTKRERVVLQGIAEGLDGPALAERLFVSLHTVKSQSRTLYRKLGARSRAEALLIARRRGLLP